MKRLITSIVICLLWTVPAFAGRAEQLIEKGDRYFSDANYASALETYEKALALEPENQALQVRIERTAVAKNADEFLSLMTRDVQKRGDIRISAKALLKKMMKGEKITFIDIRTHEEQALVVPVGAKKIQMYEIMKHLDEIPTDGLVVIICHSSPRAMIVTTALRILGYNNVYALKGGIMALADINAKKAPDGLRPITAR